MTEVAGACTPVRWVDTQSDFTDVLKQLGDVATVALDTEFHRERTYFPKLALLQLAWDPEELVLIDPLSVDISPFGSVLDSDTEIVIHASSQDLEVLRLTAGAVPRHLFDTQVAAGFVGHSNPSLASLHHDLLDMHLDKGDRLTDWLARPLSDSVLDYAAGDVRYLLRIHDRLMEDLTVDGRLEWALAECEEARLHGMAERDPDEAWKKVKDARRLTGKAAGVARAVAAWRERRAAELDIPVRFVLGDLALVGISQRPPTTIDALRRIRGVDGRSFNDSTAAGLLAVVAAGVDQGPPPTLKTHKPASGRHQRPAVTLLSSWLAQFAKEQRIDTQLLATRHDIEDFVQGGDSGRLASGWRRDLVGEPMRQLLSGEAALAFESDRGIVLEPRRGQADSESGKPVNQ